MRQKKFKGRACQVDTHEFAHGLAVVDGIVRALIDQAVSLLHDIHPQHASDADVRAAHAAAAGIGRLGQRDQSRSRHQLLHLAQELLAS